MGKISGMGFRVSVVVWVVPTTSFRKPYSHSPTAKIFGEGIDLLGGFLLFRLQFNQYSEALDLLVSATAAYRQTASRYNTMGISLLPEFGAQLAEMMTEATTMFPDPDQSHMIKGLAAEIAQETMAHLEDCE